MSKLLLSATLLLSASVLATEDAPCDKGSSCGQVDVIQGQTNANSPVFNSQPNMNMSGSNVLIQQAMDSFVRMGDIQCPSTTLHLNGYANRNSSETFPVSYENRSSGYGISFGVGVPLGSVVSKCEEAQELHLTTMRWKVTEDNVRMCVDMINNNFQVSDQMKKSVKEFAFCDHIRKAAVERPAEYAELVSQLKKENAQLKEKTSENASKELKLVGYREWRVRFVDYINGCTTGCNGEFKSVAEYLSNIKKEFGNEKYQIHAEPYQNGSRISVYIRGEFYTWDKAEIARQRFVVAGIPAKVVGVSGSEIYKAE
jgi:hypothetical protein